MEIENFLNKIEIDKSHINYLVNQIITGKLTIANLHNKKSYARRNNQHSKIIEYAIVFEIVKMIKE